MKTPGTLGSLVLRVGQLASAMVALVVTSKSTGYSYYSAYCLLAEGMRVQCIWSCATAIFDMYALVARRGPSDFLVVHIFLICDWIFGACSLAVACVAAGVTMFLDRDFQWCREGNCIGYMVGISFAFLSWLLITTSFMSSFWFLARG